jgi:hypothetical protein
MKTKRCLMIGLALALAGALSLAGAALAQNRGGGGPGGQGNQLCTGGPGGTCMVNPPNNLKTQNCPGNGAGKAQRQKGPKGRNAGQANQPTPQANPPAAGQ